MKIGFIVNEIETEKAKYTTIRLALTATNRGHDVWIMGVGDLANDPKGYIKAWGKKVSRKKYNSSEIYLKELQSEKCISQRIAIEELDVLFLRNDPSHEPSSRAWARSIGIHFGRLAAKHGVIVVNDPSGLSNASNKMYFQQFPETIRPKSLITRDRDELKKFAKKYKKIILKPLLGSGGKNVFFASRTQSGNMNQMIDAVSRDGYVVAQEFIPHDYDIRLFLMNGVPLRYKGKYAAFRRRRSGDDVRSNVHVGASIEKVEVDSKILKVAEIVRPKIVQDGMFFVGLDIIGDKILEINLFSPGGLGSAQKLEGVNFTVPVIKALERKVQYMGYYNRKFDNSEMATL